VKEQSVHRCDGGVPRRGFACRLIDTATESNRKNRI